MQEKTRGRLGLCFQGVYSLGGGMGYAEDEPAAAGNKSISDEDCAALVPLEVSMQFLGRRQGYFYSSPNTSLTRYLMRA